MLVLSRALGLDLKQIDDLIVDNPPVLRTIKGHVFETFFDTFITKNGYEVKEIGGDKSIDRIVNKYTLQLKTPNMAGTKNNFVEYKTHKTHGAKSENESIDYYHRVDRFADFLVGLISYDPFRIIFISRDELPRTEKSILHIKSPFRVDITRHPGINSFERIGVSINSDFTDETLIHEDEYFSRTCEKLSVSSEIILNTILKQENFRIWDMNLRGFAREKAFKNYSQEIGLKLLKPIITGRKRHEKADYVALIDNVYEYYQIKGISTNNCNLYLKDPIIATETQLTRGRVNDHPTQSRLYRYTDFDYLILCLEPPIVRICHEMYHQSLEIEQWEFYKISMKLLKRHSKFSNRIKSIQKFLYSTLQMYKI